MSKKILWVALACVSLPGLLAAQPVFQAPVVINPAGSGERYLSMVSAAANGHIGVAWLRQSGEYIDNSGVPIPFTKRSQVMASFTADDGVTWSAPAALTDTSIYCNEVDMAADPAGNFYLAWSSGDTLSGMRLHTAVTSDYGQSFTSSTRLQSFLEAGQGIMNPKVNLAGQNMVVSWAAAKRGVIDKPFSYFISTQSSDLQQWGSTVEVGSPSELLSSVYFERGVAIDGNTTVLVGDAETPYDYSGYSRPRVFFSRSTDGNQTWSTPQVVTTQTLYGREPSVATDGNGVFMLAYSGTTSINFNAPAKLYVQKSTDGGATWSTPQITANGDFVTQNGNDIAGDGTGRWIIFTERNNYTYSEDNGQTWSDITPFNMANIPTMPDIRYLGNDRWLLVKNHQLVFINWARAGVNDWNLY